MDTQFSKCCMAILLLTLQIRADDIISRNESSTEETHGPRTVRRILTFYPDAKPEQKHCINEGFQPDPHDCAVFYRCMKSGNGRYTVFKFECGPGTIYDPDTEVCNHPQYTKRSECGGLRPVDQSYANEINIEQQELPSPITTIRPVYTYRPTTSKSISTMPTTAIWATEYTNLAYGEPLRTTTKRHDSTYNATASSVLSTSNKPQTTSSKNATSTETFWKTTTKPIWSTPPLSLTISSNTRQPSFQNNLCTSDGFMGDSENCHKFYRCVGNERGGFTRYEFSCSESTIWDEDLQACNHPWAVKRSRCGRSDTNIPNKLNSNKHILPMTNTEALNKHESSQGNFNKDIEDPSIQQQLQISYGSKVTQTQTQISNAVTKQNQTQIHYGDRINNNITPSIQQNQSQVSHDTAISQTQTQINYGNELVQIQLQVDHSKSTNQSQTQVNEITKTSTTISQHDTYEGKTSTTKQFSSINNNGCEQSGFMGDQNDCKKFYRCVDNGRGSYTRHEFSCGEGTVWDSKMEGCNHAWAVKECGSKLNIESTSQGAVTPSITYPTSTIKSTNSHHNSPSIFTKLTTVDDNESTEDFGYENLHVHDTNNVSSSNETTKTTTTEYSELNDGAECESSGFIGDKNNCKIFYRCIENGDGKYTKFEFKCGEGTVWDPEIEACNHAWAVKKCGKTASSDFNKTESTTKTFTSLASTILSTHQQSSTSSSSIHPESSISSVTKPVETDYDYDNGYGGSKEPVNSSTEKTTKRPEGQDNNKNGICRHSGFMGDKDDCKKFYRCVDDGNGKYTKFEFKCGEGTVWDSEIEACNHAWAVKKCGEMPSSDFNKTESTTKTTTPLASTIFSTHPQTSTSSSLTHPESSISSTVTTKPIETDNDYENGYGISKEPVNSSTENTTKGPEGQDNNKNGICKHSGFMGDKDDCKKFYRCVDNGNGSYTRYEFTCGQGTVWDSKIEACNHVWAVESCGFAVTVTEYPITSSFKPTKHHEETITSQSTLVSSDKETEATSITTLTTLMVQTTTIRHTSEKCNISGFTGDTKDCKKFYRCVANGDGSFTRYEFHCGEGTVWDKKIEACNHVWAVKECGVNQQIPVEDSLVTSSFKPVMNDEEIDIGYPINDELNQSSTTIRSTTQTNKKCVKSGFFGDKDDCKKFYRCVEDGKGGFIQYEFTCGEGTVWDQEIEACNHAWTVKQCSSEGLYTTAIVGSSTSNEMLTTAAVDNVSHYTTEKVTTSNPDYNENEIIKRCTKEGFVGDNTNCKKFYRCVNNGHGGFTSYEFTCGEGTYWNQEIQSCDHATLDKPCGTKEGNSTKEPQHENDEMHTETTIKTSTYATTHMHDLHTTINPQIPQILCREEGFYGDPNDCKKFYRCVDDGRNGFTKYEFICGDDTFWNDEIQACDHEYNNHNCSHINMINSSTHKTTHSDVITPTSTSSPTATSEQPTTQKVNTSSSSNDYECKSDGFYANPNDCKKFIRCVNSGKGGYTKYDFTCGEGTIWVQNIQACDHDDGSESCKNDVNDSLQTTEGIQTSTERPQNTSSTSTTTEPQIPTQQDHSDKDESASSENNNCFEEGYYGNKKDCRKFYQCVDNGHNGFTKYEFMCGEGTAWDDNMKSCNNLSKVVSCTGSYQKPSDAPPVYHDDDNQQTTTTKSSSTSVPTTISESTSSTISTNKENCESEGYFGDTNDCKKFYRCVDNGKGGFTKYEYICSDGTIWDRDITTCNHPNDVVNLTCEQGQVESDSSTSSSTTTGTASPSNTGSESTTTTTNNQSSSNCSQESSSKPQNKNITCEKAGFYPDPDDCKKFYRCVDWDGDGKRFSVYHFTCGEGTIWDPVVQTCNHEDSVYPPRDCSGTNSQTENANQENTTTETTTAQELTTTQQSSTSDQTTTEMSTTTEQSTSSTERITTTTPTPSSTTTQQSTTSEKTTTQQQSTTEQTTMQTSSTSEQTTQQTTTEQSTTQQPTTTQSSTTSEQTTTQKSSTSEQTTTQPSTSSEHTTIQQTSTSEQTTTQQSTTSDQTTTQQPSTTETTTTEQTVTSEQTTQSQTTTESTTEQQTTGSLTTGQTIEGTSTTEQDQTTTEQTSPANQECPDTDDDQYLLVCPTSFKRHPKYCNMFYQCTEDDDSHETKIAVFTCPNNTIYDESKIQCVEEAKAEKKCDGELARIRKVKRLGAGNKEPITVGKHNQSCPAVGHYPFERDAECSPAFLRCNKNKGGKLRGYVHRCPEGYVYWSVSRRCERTENVRGCQFSKNNWSSRWEVPIEFAL